MIDITPKEDKIKNLYNLIYSEIVNGDESVLIEELIIESIKEYVELKGDIFDFSDAKVHCLFSIIRKMRILDGSWNHELDFE